MTQSGGGIFSALQNFDAYPKTLEDFRIKTFAGAGITLISSFIMIMLFISELHYYMTTEVTDELFTDMTLGDKIQINMDFTLHKMPCAYVTVDAMDVSGQRQIDFRATLFKQRLTKDGNAVMESEILDMEEGIKKNLTAKSSCGSCYGAQTEDMKCCSTCQDVRDAYNKKGWVFPKGNTVVQCKTERLLEQIEMQSGEGCRLHGHLVVNRVAGNFHLAPGKSIELGDFHIHDFKAFGDKPTFNLSHTITHLSFSENYPDQIFPLDNSYVDAEKSEMVFQYYLKIVPTTYINLNGDKLKTNQFSVTKNQQDITGRNDGTIGPDPGIFMSYELAPMMIRKTENRRSFLHFLTSVCAIIGGVFTVAGLIDSAIYHGGRALQRKIELGKVTEALIAVYK